MSIKRLARPALIAAAPTALVVALVLASGGEPASRQAASPAKASHQTTTRTTASQHSVIAYPGAATHLSGLAATETGPNWSGFAATGPRFRYVQATFLVPHANCRKTPGTTKVAAMAADWVGLDGLNQSSVSVEQDGFSVQCQNGVASYGAWYEMFPKPPVYPNMTINPGDVIKASVWYNPGKHKYRLNLSDLTNGQGFSVWKRCSIRACQNISAEVITEDPAMSASANAKYFPLADIGTSTFWHVSITDMSGNRSGFGNNNWQIIRLLMTGKGGRTKASTSGLGAGGTAFRTYWEHAS